ncbi:MAG: TGS domain-containing protein [Candidatus Eremiobacteraeota bacterium]|nr:TGS domain-containing protein [Candidatus Eremiobacteraeota bacterium]
MSANLTPEYRNAEEKYRQAKTSEEKLEYLELMLTTIPKHKGTDKMQADIKRRIAKLKKGELKKGGKRQLSYHVEKQGAGQVILMGPPNAGKTRLVNTVTNAQFNVGDYPFTTRIMQPAMMPFEDIQIQLVDTPAIHPDYYERWVLGLIRNADVAILVADLSNPDILDNLDNLISILEDGRITLTREFLKEKPVPGFSKKKTLLAANKMDIEIAGEHLEILKEFFGEKFKIFPISCETGEGISEFKRAIFDNLDVIRVYTKTPGRKPDVKHPFILKAGKTVEDLAYHIHKDLARNMRFARIWGKGYYDGQPVDQHHPLQDEAVIEIHE